MPARGMTAAFSHGYGPPPEPWRWSNSATTRAMLRGILASAGMTGETAVIANPIVLGPPLLASTTRTAKTEAARAKPTWAICSVVNDVGLPKTTVRVRRSSTARLVRRNVWAARR